MENINKFHKYKVHNNPVGSNLPVKQKLVLQTSYLKDGEWVREPVEEVDFVNCHILYIAHKRKLTGFKGAVMCSSCNGQTPNTDKHKEPLCEQLTSEELSNTLSKWKGFDKAKVSEKMKELVNTSGRLRVCGMPKIDGTIIPLCPSTSSKLKSNCKPYIHVFAYDIDRDRVFEMELGGSSIRNWGEKLSDFSRFLTTMRKSKKPLFTKKVKLFANNEGSYCNLGLETSSDDVSSDMLSNLVVMSDKAEDKYIRRSKPFVPKTQSDSPTGTNQVVDMKQETTTEEDEFTL